jgi:hypothetical protein
MLSSPRQLSKFLAASLMTVLLGACLTGCSGCQSPPIVDAPASNVDVRLSVLDIAEVPSDGKVIVVMQFFQGGKVVQMASNVSLSCNGVPLTWNGLLSGHAERVPIQPVGGNYVFSFVRTGVPTTATVTVPPRPVFVAPTIAGASIPRTNSFTIHYVPGTGTSVRGNASDGTHSANNSQPDDGTFDNLDVSGFNAGPGVISVTRTLEGTLPGTGFLSAKTLYDTNKEVSVTWL